MKQSWFVQAYLVIHSTETNKGSMKKFRVCMKKDVHVT